MFHSLYATSTIERTQVLMGTYIHISLPLSQKEEIDNGFALLKEIEMSLSSYDKRAKVYQLNLHKSVQADKYLEEVLKASKKMYQSSNGYFDITIGSISKECYAFGGKERIPLKKELLEAKININAVTLHKGVVSLERNISIDLGGIGKGYAVDKLATYYQSKNSVKGKIALSGDIRCLDRCSISIQSPFEENMTLMTLKSKRDNLSISTSGTYRRFVKEKKYHHLINPKTRKQGTAFASVTLFTDANNTKIDALATAIGVMSEKDALILLKKEPSLGYILVKTNGKIIEQNRESFFIK